MHTAGYDAVETPLYERDELFLRGVGTDDAALGLTSGPPPAVRFSDPRASSDAAHVVALRVDFTPQIARLWATRLAHIKGPHRLRYEGPVVRVGEPLVGAPSELYQLGAELIDEAGPAGDIELIELVSATLKRSGVSGAMIDLGPAGFVRRAVLPALTAMLDPRPLRTALRHADTREGAKISASAPGLDKRQRRLVSALPSLRGGRELITEAESLCKGDRIATRCIVELRAILAGLPVRTHAVTLDLGEVRGLHYYTGARFAAYAPGVGRALVLGGRYDSLLARFGRAAPAAGFAIELDALDEASLVAGLHSTRRRRNG